jgi:uncharacterized protein YjdB
MTVPTSAAKCTRCGAPVAAGARFCATCGADVSGEQGQAATAYVPKPDAKATLSSTGLLQALRHATAGEYDIHAELGRGGMATVFLAHDLALDRKVAIKVMSPHLLTGEGMIERFKREARTAASLSHPHIIPIYAVRESESLVFFVMKFVEGRPLDSIIKEVGPLPIPMVRAILQQVGGALGYAHRRGIVHRDVKPANVMIDADGWAVVTDFGIAKATETKGLTMTGATIGTPSYMSPEQCAAKEVAGASDQYSLGIVAYEMVTGRLPFQADSIMAIMYAHFNEPPPPIAKLRPDCPPEIAQALERMLAKEPADRFPDVEAAVAALGAVPLAHDDPIRTQMMTLAATGLSAETLRRVATPVSPSPAGRTKAPRTVAPTTGMTLSPARVTVAVGGAVQMTATRKSRGGVTLPGDAITWASTDNEIATVSETGLVTAVGPGSAIITATMGAVSATGQITVTPAHARRRRAPALIGALVVLGGAGVGAWLFGPWRTTGQQTAAPTNVPASVATPPQPPDSAPAVARDTPSAVVVSQPPAPTRPAVSRPDPRLAQLERRRNDSTLTVLRAAASTARGRAAAAGATTADLAAGDQHRDTAEGLARSGRYDDAFARYNDAQAQWRLAEQTARDRAAQLAAANQPRVDPNPAPVNNPAPPPVPTAPSPAAMRQQIVDAILAYGRALESRNIAQIRQAYPGLTTAQERGWRDFFQVAQNLRVSLGVTDLQQSLDAADATVTGTFEYRDSQSRRDQRQPVSFHASLERSATGWRITSIR